MPELPEIETLRRQLAGALPGARIERVTVRWPKLVGNGSVAAFRRQLRGARFREPARRGKNLLLHLDVALTLVAQMRMTGQLLLKPKRARLDPHTHLRLRLSGAPDDADLHLRDTRKFARFYLAETENLDALPTLRGLGPEPLHMSARELAEILRGRSAKIKSLLLDQRRIAGLGNIYVDECLHAARIHPETPAGETAADRVRALHAAIRRILNAAIRAGGSSLRDYVHTNGQKGAFRASHRVYRRAGQPCRRCGAAILRSVVGGRGTHWCPSCQPAPPAGKSHGS